ncbi:hypothetical protein [Candidatus Accumulibacter aalborgensis]|uniref:hypothetical protein n=1 Tax=Candidatus Accumulibacter aalborgensis TaxID=1860102 RepID=UPI0016489C2E|nr:hypothetical protein [Candidatus Accumulibacter aalborgensis]
MNTFINSHRHRTARIGAVASPVVLLGTEHPVKAQEAQNRDELHDWEDECGRPAGNDAPATVS